MENRDKKKPAKKKSPKTAPTTPKKPAKKNNATEGKQKTLFDVLGVKSATAKDDEDKKIDYNDNGAHAEEESSSPTVVRSTPFCSNLNVTLMLFRQLVNHTQTIL